VTVVGGVGMKKQLRVGGLATLEKGLTVVASGVKVTAGGVTVTAGGVKAAGGITVDDTGVVVTTGGATITDTGLTVTAGVVAVGETADATSSTAGAVTVVGGVGMKKQLRVGGLATLEKGLTVVASGVKVTAGGVTVTAGGVKAAGGLTVDDSGLVVTAGGVTTTSVTSSGSLDANAAASNAVTFSIGGTEKARLHSNGYLGIGTASPTVELDVNGGVKGTSAYQQNSDRRWKKNVNILKESLRNVMNITGVTYEWRKEEFPHKNFRDGIQIGFVAQDIEKVLPELVTTDGEGWKSVSYGLLSPILVEAIKDQQAQIEEQQLQISLQQSEIIALQDSLHRQELRLKHLESKITEAFGAQRS